MRISDWSSDVCSSDLTRRGPVPRPARNRQRRASRQAGAMPGREARPQAWQRNFGVRRACDARHRESTDGRRPKPEKVQWRGQVRRSSIISIVSGRHFTKRRIQTEIETYGSQNREETRDRIEKGRTTLREKE